MKLFKKITAIACLLFFSASGATFLEEADHAWGIGEFGYSNFSESGSNELNSISATETDPNELTEEELAAWISLLNLSSAESVGTVSLKITDHLVERPNSANPSRAPPLT